jgi:hypothetical protein
MLKFFTTSIAVVALLLFATSAEAALVPLSVEGLVTDVNDSPFADGEPTLGISPGDMVTGTLTYDTTTAQPSGDLISFELVQLLLTVPDTTQDGDSFDMIPADLNSATRIVFDGEDFHGLLLPKNITGFEDLTAFGLTGVDFESSGFQGPDFKFNLGFPVVEGVFTVETFQPLPALTLVGRAILALALAVFALFAGQGRLPWRLRS